MQQIINFFIANRNFFLFAGLFAVSIALTIRSHDYHRGKFMNSSNAVSGRIYTLKNNIGQYFRLESENKSLVRENLFLKQELETYRETQPEPGADIIPVFKYRAAVVINNSYSKTKNYLTVNKGENDSIAIDMGVISNQGIIGIVSHVSGKYALVQSVLNTNSRIHAKLKSSNHFGTLVWNAKDPAVVQLTDIPRIAELHKGDTVITGGRSTIFPEGIPIGTIRDFYSDKDDNYFYINVSLFNDMTALQYVYLIENNDAEEISELEKEVADEN